MANKYLQYINNECYTNILQNFPTSDYYEEISENKSNTIKLK